MKNSRVKNTLRNSIIGFISYGIKIILSFIARTYFIKILGVEYLGVNGLFSNILSIVKRKASSIILGTSILIRGEDSSSPGFVLISIKNKLKSVSIIKSYPNISNW